MEENLITNCNLSGYIGNGKCIEEILDVTHSHELLLKITCSGISYQYIGWPIATRRQSQKDGDGNNLENTERGEKGGEGG